MKDFPNLATIEELATFLNHRQIPDEDLCRFLMFNTFNEVKSGAVLVAKKDNNNKIGWTKAFGSDGTAVEVVHEVDLDEKLPDRKSTRLNSSH